MMREFKAAEKDFRRWILFNNKLNDFQSLYELYTSVDSKKSKGEVSISEEIRENKQVFIIEQQGSDSILEINGETDRKRFLEYMVQHYFPNQEIEEWYQSKIETKEKLNNHLISDQTSNNGKSYKSLSDFRIHPKESKYYNFRVFISACFYIVVFGFVISSFLNSSTNGVVTLLIIAVVTIFFLIVKRFAQGLFIGIMKGNAVKISEYQYPEIFEIVKDQANQLELKEIPDVYISYGDFNAFVTKLARRKYLMLYSEVIETISRGNFEVLKFVIGHELGHLKRRHISKETWLIPSSFVPFLRLAYSRACEYTCDRIGYHFSNQGSVEGILILATGKEIHSKINVNRFIEDSESENSFWVWFSEKFLSHPHTSKRLSAIMKYDQRWH